MSATLSFSTFSGFSQLFSLSGSTWLLIFASLIIARFAHFVITSIVLMCKSYNGIKEFQGPPAHWLKGHTDRVSEYKRKLATEIFSHKSELRFRREKIVLKVNAVTEKDNKLWVSANCDFLGKKKKILM